MSASITFDGVSKRFRRGAAHDSLRDLLPALGRRLVGRAPPEHARDFWALRDLSFSVAPGEVLGIIGPNGAGKSTALKLLNGIMDPTTGTVSAEGRIGALIEVSAGFHQDLTGRQNVFLQGAIMGMRKAEIRRKFDEIVAFAGVEEFIDTPVKRYSSGMNARLGFSIAAHLEPDILVIDEVLAVGDHAFQQRAFARIKAMATDGAPVVLVSHQLDRVAELCTKAILLERGTVREVGTPLQCINEYLYGLGAGHQDPHGPDGGAPGIEFTRMMSQDGLAVRSGTELRIVVEGHATIDAPPPPWYVYFRVVDPRTGAHLHNVSGPDRGIDLPTRGPFRYELALQMNLQAGSYHVEACVWDDVGDRDVLVGPRLQVEVLECLKFHGTVQLNSRWTAVDPAAAQRGAGPPA